jgi:transglutaminase-like putative cysteine protease
MEDAIRALLVASPYHISDAALAGTIRYRLALEDGLAWTIPETGEQHVERRGDEIELTICATCGHEAPPADADLHRYLEPNAWVQSRDPRVIGFANAAMGHSVDLRMRGLVRVVQMHMTGAIDFREYQTAVQALDSRGGDCTEFAILLAAAARARGILQSPTLPVSTRAIPAFAGMTSMKVPVAD